MQGKEHVDAQYLVLVTATNDPERRYQSLANKFSGASDEVLPVIASWHNNSYHYKNSNEGKQYMYVCTQTSIARC